MVSAENLFGCTQVLGVDERAWNLIDESKFVGGFVGLVDLWEITCVPEIGGACWFVLGIIHIAGNTFGLTKASELGKPITEDLLVLATCISDWLGSGLNEGLCQGVDRLGLPVSLGLARRQVVGLGSGKCDGFI